MAKWPPPFFLYCFERPHSHLSTQGPALNYGSDQYVLLVKLNQGMQMNSPRSPNFHGQGGEKTDQGWTEKTPNGFQM